MKKQDCFLFGTIFKLHGYKGDVNIYNNNEIPIVLNDIKFFYIQENNELIPYFPVSVRLKKKNVLLVKFEDVDSEREALKILKKKVYLPNYFLTEGELLNQNKIIIGFNVLDKSLGNIGKVEFINDSTKQNLIIVKNSEKEFFIPFHDQFIVNIDVANKILEVNIPQELIDIN